MNRTEIRLRVAGGIAFAFVVIGLLIIVLGFWPYWVLYGLFVFVLIVIVDFFVRRKYPETTIETPIVIGAEDESKPVCPSCGSSIEEGETIYCSECGAKLA